MLASLAGVVLCAAATTVFWAVDDPPAVEELRVLASTAGVEVEPDSAVRTIDASGVGPRHRFAAPLERVDIGEVRSRLAGRSVTDDGRFLTVWPDGDDAILLHTDGAVMRVTALRLSVRNDRAAVSTAVALLASVIGAAAGWVGAGRSARPGRRMSAALAPLAVVATGTWALAIATGSQRPPGPDPGSALLFGLFYLAPVWGVAGVLTALMGGSLVHGRESRSGPGVEGSDERLGP